MTKVVSYLFDSMFQGKSKISFGEKVVVVLIAAIVITSALIFVI